MATIGTAVMAHPQREHLVSRLVEQLGLDSSDVVWDTKNNRWDTGRRAMQAAAAHNADWTCVIQDDVLVCKDLLEGLRRALDHVPGECIVQPYVGTRISKGSAYIPELTRQADEQNASWIEMRTLFWGPVIIVPTPTVTDMLTWADRRNWPNYDKRVGQYYYSKLAWTTYYTWPSLVDHLDSERDGVDSLVEHGSGRVARNFIGEDASALDIDWSGPVVQMRGLASMYARQAAARRAQRQQENDRAVARQHLKATEPSP